MTFGFIVHVLLLVFSSFIAALLFVFTKFEFLTKTIQIYLTPDQFMSLILPLFIFAVAVVLLHQYYKLDKKMNSLDRKKLILEYNRNSNKNLFYTIFALVLSLDLTTFFNVLYKLRSELNDYLYLSVVLFVIDILTLLMIIYFFILNRRGYKNRIKSYLNDKYATKFPYVDATTVGGNKVSGKVSYVFDQRYLILDNNGTKEIVLWQSIDTLKLQDFKIYENNLQKMLSEYV